MINVCYHGIGTPRRELEPDEDRYWLTRDQFLRSLDELATWPATTITFDDGNLSDVEVALPALVERELKASFFVLAGRLESAGSLGRESLRYLREQGMAIGSHGMHHRPWTELSDRDLHTELVVARCVLGDALGERIDHVALPLGRYNRRVIQALRREGYERVYSSDQAPARTGSWLQPRYSITGDDTAESLRTRIRSRQGLVHRTRGWLNTARKTMR